MDVEHVSHEQEEKGPDLPQPVDAGKPSDAEKLLAGFAYISQVFLPAILPVVLLCSAETKGSSFLHYHSVQSLGLLIISLIYYLVAAIFYFSASSIASCLLCVLWVIFLVPAGVFLYCGIRAFLGERFQVPWLTDFLKENNWL